MQLFVREKSFYTQLAAITIPIALQNLINVGVSVADTMMIGALGEVQLSAVSLANQLGFILMLLSFGTGGGAGVLIAQFWGKRDVASIHRYMAVAYRFMFAVSLLFFALAVFWPGTVMRVFTTDPAVIAEGEVFLRIVGCTFPFWCLTTITLNMLRAVRAVKISVAVSLSAFAANVFLNWVFIFGNLGAPALGVAGGAIATFIARVVELLVAGVYLFFIEKSIRFRPRMLFMKKLGEGVISSFAHTAAPVALNELLWSMGYSTIAVIIGRMGREFTAAQAINSVLGQFVTIVLFAMSNATAVMTGNIIGEGDYARARRYSVTFMALSGLLGLVSSSVVLLLRDFMLDRYNISDLAREYGVQIISVNAVLVFFQALATTIIVGVLRGGGDTRYALIMDIVFLWGVCVPLGFLTGLYLKWPIWAVYAVLRCDEIIKVFVSLPKILRGGWINDVTVRAGPK